MNNLGLWINLKDMHRGKIAQFARIYIEVYD
jgi:hypothetical protein